jgi:hypothetical protein
MLMTVSKIRCDCIWESISVVAGIYIYECRHRIVWNRVVENAVVKTVIEEIISRNFQKY